MKRTIVITCILLLTLLVPTMIGAARGSSALDVVTTVSCSSVEFVLNAPGESASYDLIWDFGDDNVVVETGVSAFPYVVVHDYPATGKYRWSLSVTDGTEIVETRGVVKIDGPSVKLMSDPFPPLVDLEGDGIVNFSAKVKGGTAPYTYAWDLNGDGVLDEPGDAESGTASYTYTESGEVIVRVEVTDACGLSASDTLRVLVGDVEDEEDEEGEDSCHKMDRKHECERDRIPGQDGQCAEDQFEKKHGPGEERGWGGFEGNRDSQRGGGRKPHHKHGH